MSEPEYTEGGMQRRYEVAEALMREIDRSLGEGTERPWNERDVMEEVGVILNSKPNWLEGLQ